MRGWANNCRYLSLILRWVCCDWGRKDLFGVRNWRKLWSLQGGFWHLCGTLSVSCLISLVFLCWASSKVSTDFFQFGFVFLLIYHSGIKFISFLNLGMLVYVTNSMLCESEPVSFSIRICFSIGNFCICDATVILNWYFSPSVFEEILNLRGYESVNNLTKTCFIISPHMFYNFRGEYRTWGIRYLLLFTKWFGIVFWLNCLLALVVFG